MSRKLLVSILVLMVAGFMVTKASFAAITGKAHDFSTEVWNTSGQICIVCHTPHNASSSPLAPLWNHASTTANFTPYSSPNSTLNANVGQPSNASKACLSCHDGTVAVDSFGGKTNGTDMVTGSHLIGTDLSNDHPVSFTYDAALATADGGLYNPTLQTVASLGGKTITAGMLVNGKVECSSCHDVHADKGDSSSADDLLLVANTKSALCLTCHSK